MIVITGLPLPITSNHMYDTAFIRSKSFGGRAHAQRVKSKDYKSFQRDCALWHQQNQRFMINVSHELADWLKEGYQIKLDLYFVMERKRLFTLKDEPKKLDASNRIKPIEDALATMLGIDDRHFWRPSAEKIECNQEGEECTIAVMTKMNPMNYPTLKNLMKQKQMLEAL